MRETLVNWYRAGHTYLTKKGLRYPFLKKINGIVIQKLKSDKAVIDGHTIYLDKDDSMRLSTRGHYEPFVADIAKKYLKEGDIVFDIGANIGYFTLLFARLVGKKGKVYAFEPNSENMRLLKKNAEANGYTNIVFVEKAVSNKNEKMKFYLSNDSSTRHSLHENEYCRSSFIEVEAVALNDYFDAKQKVHFIKLDVEGAEFDALQGMSRLLQENEKITLVTEFTPDFLKNLNINPKDFINFLQENNFTLFNVNENSIDPFTLEKVSHYLKKGKKVNMDLLCVKEE